MKAILKYLISRKALIVYLVLGVGIFYFRHSISCYVKELVRDNKGWLVSTSENEGIMTKTILSPSFHVNDIFPSMTGPWEAHYFDLMRTVGPELVWFKGYRCSVRDAETKDLLGDEFLCHNSLDYSISDYYRNWGIKGRVGVFTSRLATMTQGQTDMILPDGFGIPLQSNQALSALTQVLNVNRPKADLHVEYLMEVDYLTDKSVEEVKPLFQQSVSVLVEVDTNYLYHGNLPEAQDCLPVLTSREFMKKCRDGHTFTGHWLLPKGKDTIRYDVTDILSLPFTTTLHYVGVHVHPHCESLELWDKTENKLIFRSTIENHKSLSKMNNIEAFSSISGVTMHNDHRYELICTTRSKSERTRDMMATMLLYLYDKEMAETLAGL